MSGPPPTPMIATLAVGRPAAYDGSGYSRSQAGFTSGGPDRVAGTCGKEDCAVRSMTSSKPGPLPGGSLTLTRLCEFQRSRTGRPIQASPMPTSGPGSSAARNHDEPQQSEPGADRPAAARRSQEQQQGQRR